MMVSSAFFLNAKAGNYDRDEKREKKERTPAFFTYCA
jgi:hypothetical protein